MATRYSFAAGHIAHLANPTANFMTSFGPQMDQWGRFWLCAGGNGTTGLSAYAIDQTGTIVQSYTQNTIINAAGTYALANQTTANWPSNTGQVLYDTGFSTIVVQSGGQSKLVAFFNKSNAASPTGWYFTVAVFAIDAAGALTCQGVVWSPSFGLTSNFLVRTNWIDLAGNKDFTQDIVVMCGIGATSDFPLLLKFPSINTINGTAYSFSQTQFQWAAGVGTPNGLGTATSAEGITVGGLFGSLTPAAFLMPNASSGTDVLMYLNKRCMDTSSIPFVTATAVTYPNGVMCKLALPAGGYSGATGSPTATPSATMTPVATPACFSTGAASFDAFTDIQKNVDGTSGAGYNDYYAWAPVLVNEGSGSFLVGWYQPWFQNNNYTGAWSVVEKLRIMRYTSASGVFTDVSLLQGATVPISSIGSAAGGSPDYIDICGWQAFADGSDLKIWHCDGASGSGSAISVTWLGHIGTAIVGQVTVHTRIGDARTVALSAPTNIALPSISGVPDVGNTLAGDAGTWTGNP